MLFWFVAPALALLVATLFALALLRSRAEAEHPAEYDLRIYRDQLKEVDRDLARNVISESEAARLRTEVGRRVLAADAQLAKAAQIGAQPHGLTRTTAALTALVLLGGALGIYSQIGSPGQGDLPHKARLDQARALYENRPSQQDYIRKLPPQPAPQADPTFEELIAKLREAVAENPQELQGQQFLATNEARLGNFEAAQKAQRAVIALKGDTAVASDHVALAQMYISHAQGFVSPEAEAELRAALALSEDHPVARYFLGLMWAQNDRPDRSFSLWSKLLEAGPENAPWIGPIRESIDDVAWLAGVDYTQPEPVPAAPPEPAIGPTADDIENAAGMSAQDRQEMIQGMVARLAERLASEGGSAAEWARLIGAYGTLGEVGRAKAILAEAQTRFAGRPEDLELIGQTAKRAGITP